MSKRLKLAGAAIVVLLVLIAAIFFVWTRWRYSPRVPRGGRAGPAGTDGARLVRIRARGRTECRFHLLPGRTCRSRRYARLLDQQLSDGGVIAVIVPMPLNLAVFGIACAAPTSSQPIRTFDTWIIGGHSSVVRSAAEYVKTNPDAVDGIAFLASYPHPIRRISLRYPPRLSPSTALRMASMARSSKSFAAPAACRRLAGRQ